VTKFRVKELARERGLTSEELAIKSGVKFSTVRNLWQNRVSNPSFDTLRLIAQALGVSIEDLVDNGVDGGDILDLNTPKSIRAPILEAV
jgi:transcriptional regulator with XRE-family HTH domain